MVGQASLEEVRMGTKGIAWMLLEKGCPIQTNAKKTDTFGELIVVLKYFIRISKKDISPAFGKWRSSNRLSMSVSAGKKSQCESLTLSCCRSTCLSGGSFPPGGYADSDGGYCPEPTADLCLYDINMSDATEMTENGILDTLLGSKQSRPTRPQA